MLPSKNRLTKKPDFEKVKTEGELLTGRFLGILYTPNGLDLSRFGFIVSTKISKKAVLRNRAKRLLRETIRTLLPKIKEGFDILLLAKKGLVEVAQDQILKEEERLFKKGGLIS